MTFLLTLFGTEVAKMNENLLYFLVFICNIVVMRGKKVEMHRTFSQESFLFFSSYQVKCLVRILMIRRKKIQIWSALPLYKRERRVVSVFICEVLFLKKVVKAEN